MLTEYYRAWNKVELCSPSWKYTVAVYSISKHIFYYLKEYGHYAVQRWWPFHKSDRKIYDPIVTFELFSETHDTVSGHFVIDSRDVEVAATYGWVPEGLKDPSAT